MKYFLFSLIRKIIFLTSLICISLFPVCLKAQDTSDTLLKLNAVARAVIRSTTFRFIDEKSGKVYSAAAGAPADARLKPESPYNDWRYWNGVLNIAMIKLGEVLNEPVYSDFAGKNVRFNFDNYGYFKSKYNGEGKWNYPYGEFFIMEELDDCGAMGASIIEVYRTDKDERYLDYIQRAAEHIMKKQTRLEDGTFVRSFPVKWTLWADDLYMGLSFLTRMGEFTGDGKYFDDAARQVIQFHKYLYDEKTGLMHHCWYSDENRTGKAFWGRANGWAILAQTDLLDRLPANHPLRDTLLTLFKRHMSGIAKYQDRNGLWHQLLDKTDSYLETSCSAMFTYAAARGIEMKYIESSFATVALKGWNGLMQKIGENGEVEGVCTGTIVSDDLAYYYNRPAPLNDVHGLGTILLAGAEIVNMTR